MRFAPWGAFRQECTTYTQLFLDYFFPRSPLPQAMHRQRLRSSLSAQDGASRQAERRIESFRVIWLTTDLNDLRICLNTVHSYRNAPYGAA
ncbi:hypothetical protein MCERH10_00543 [Caulobacteraceae bacterium]